MALPQPIVPLSESAVIDAAAVARGADLGELMERAGAAIAEAVLAREPRPTSVLVATGAGNNGGDGWVCARELHRRGVSVRVWEVREARSDLCRTQAHRAREEGVPEVEAPQAGDCDLVVDAILGAGVSGSLRDWAVTALRTIAALDCPVLAVDCPSGIGTEHVLPGVRTVCLQLGKAELLDAEAAGEFTVADIGIDPASWEEVQPQSMLRFPRHPADAHKGTNGEVLVVGGGVFPGALELACRAALASGCDLVRAWTADGPPLPASIVVHRQQGRWLSPAIPEQLSPMIARASCILIGCGLGREPGCPEAARQAFSLARDMEVPVVIDADGITALAGEIRNLPAGEAPVLVTPHGGEARTIFGREVGEEGVHAFARPDRVVLRKGRVDFITDGRRWQRNPRGNPRMAVGGTGDVLAGLGAGLLARGCLPFDAARLAVLWATTAADELWQRMGPCYRPEDLLDNLPATLRRYLEPLAMWPPGE